MLNNLLKSTETSSKRVIHKTAKVTGDLIGNKIADKITGVSKHLQQNNLETVTDKHDKEILKEIYISPEERQETNDELRLKQYNNEISNFTKV